MTGVDDVKNNLLDILLNLGKLKKSEVASFLLNTKDGALASGDKIVEIIDLMKRKKYIVERDGLLTVDPQNKDNAISEVREYLEVSRIGSQRLYELGERMDFRIPWLLASINEDSEVKHVTFSDNFNDMNVMSLCMDLVSEGLAFQYTRDVGKHHLLRFYLRRYPFDVTSILEEQVYRVVKKDMLRTHEDMVIMAMSVFMDGPLTMKDLKLNLPDLTTEHLSEATSKLAQRGLLSIRDNKIEVKEEIRPFLQGYFVWNYVNEFNKSLFDTAKSKLKSRMSNFYYFGLVERMLSNKTIQAAAPFHVVERDQLKRVDSEELVEAVKLGFLFMSEDQVMLNTAVIGGFEGILKESMSKDSLLSVRAASIAEVNSVMKKLLGQNSSELRIQDHSVDEETIRVLNDYVAKDSSLSLLLPVKLKDGSSFKSFLDELEVLRDKVRSFEVVFVGRREDNEAPFQSTYIISDDFCARLSHPIAEVGKSDDVYISLQPSKEKDGSVIPAFDMLFKYADKYWLERKGLMRMSLDEWISKHK